jgi:hypothetical protein
MPFIGNQPAEKYTSFAQQTFTIVNSQTNYTLDHSVANGKEILLYINNVKQIEGSSDAYTANGTTLTLSSALTNGTDTMYCLFIGKAIQTVNPPQGSVDTAQLVDGSVTLDKLSATGTKSSSTFLRGDNTFAVPPSITVVQQFRLAADTGGSGSNGTTLDGWEENDTDYQALGSAWSQSSGIFSTTTTGIYQLNWTIVISATSINDAFDPNIQISTDSGSTYNMRSYSYDFIRTDQTRTTISNTLIFDVADASTFRLRMRESDSNEIQTGTTIEGGSNYSATQMTFVRLGDT